MAGDRVSMSHVVALDGLRGAAIGGVLLHHGGHLKGGYLGVDLFFVLSGYLITSLLLNEWRGAGHGRIALGAFWARRARRLLPALVLLLLGVAVYCVVLAEPTELGRIRGDALATIGYVANWRAIVAGQSYFDLFRTPSPLQHTWSLAIEEQFYLLWPLMFIGLATWWKRRTPQAVFAIAVALAGISAIDMLHFYNPADPSRVYYGTDTRAFALFAGIAIAAAVAIWGHTRDRVLRAALEVAATAATATLAMMWIRLDGQSPALYRGGFALAGVAAAPLIAAAAHPQRGPIGWLLSFRPLCWLGLISYGLYLWHWPVDIVLDSTRTGLSGWTLFALRTAVAIAIAAASYLLLEMPIRRGALRAPQWRVLVPIVAAGLLAVVVVATAGAASEPAAALSTGGSRPPDTAIAIKRRLLDAHVGSNTPRAFLLGDSIALTLEIGAPNAKGAPMGVMGAEIAGCGILPGLFAGRTETFKGGLCERTVSEWRAGAAIADPAIIVAMPGAWDLYDRTVHGEAVVFGTRRYEALLNRRLTAALAIAKAHHAAFAVMSLPCLVPAGYVPPSVRGVFDQPTRVDLLNRELRAFVSLHHDDASFIDLHRHVCPHGRIDMSLRKVDGVHFSPSGAARVWRWLLPRLEAIRRR